jgi:heme exporter protein A
MNSPPLAIEARGLCRRYGRRWALLDVDLQVPRGASVLVAGRNGSGKSTLLRVLSTAIRPDRGRVLVEGFDSRDAKAEVRRRIALLGHATYTYDGLTALQNLEVTAAMGGFPRKNGELRALLDRVGLAHRAHDEVNTFSAGMRKRLSLARTLLQDASVVLLDEPYNQLDTNGFLLVDGILESLKAQGKTVLLVSHLLERGAAFCDLGIVLEEGRVHWTGPARDLPRSGGLEAARIPEAV